MKVVSLNVKMFKTISILPLISNIILLFICLFFSSLIMIKLTETTSEFAEIEINREFDFEAAFLQIDLEHASID